MALFHFVLISHFVPLTFWDTERSGTLTFWDTERSGTLTF